MNNQNSESRSHSNFWSGFSLGAVLGVAGIYLFGTKKGRQNIHKVLELTDNLEDTIEKAVGVATDGVVEKVNNLTGSAKNKKRGVKTNR